MTALAGDRARQVQTPCSSNTCRHHQHIAKFTMYNIALHQCHQRSISKCSQNCVKKNEQSSPFCLICCTGVIHLICVAFDTAVHADLLVGVNSSDFRLLPQQRKRLPMISRATGMTVGFHLGSLTDGCVVWGFVPF